MGTENQPQPFDEQAALQALEQLRGQIQDARARREQKLAEFDAFLRSNRAASHAERLAALGEIDAPAPAPAPAVQTAARSADRARDARDRTAAVTSPLSSTTASSGLIVPPRLEPVHASYTLEPQPDPFAEAPARRLDYRLVLGLGAAAAIVAVALVLYLRPWRADQSAPAAAPTTSTSAAPAAGRRPAPSAAPATTSARAAPPAVARALQIELTTTRPVWMRVVADGARVEERQVPGGHKLIVGADRAIVIRAGDAGAVRLRVGGVDRGTLGRAGQVVTRTLTPNQR